MAEKTAYFFLRTSVGKEAEAFIRKFDDGLRKRSDEADHGADVDPEGDPLPREKGGEK